MERPFIDVAIPACGAAQSTASLPVALHDRRDVELQVFAELLDLPGDEMVRFADTSQITPGRRRTTLHDCAHARVGETRPDN